MFIFRIGSIAYSSGSMALLGLVVPSGQVAIYGGADRFFRAASMLIGPIGEVIFPKISYLTKKDPVKARAYQKYGSLVIITLSALLSVVVFVLTPYIIRYLLGEKYIASIEILRILSLNIFLIGIGTSIGVVYIIPKGFDNIFATATVVAGAWNIFSIFYLVPRRGISWMAWSINISELVVILTCIFMILWRKKYE